MKCNYHPEQEASALCVSCGKPVCSECSILLKDNKMHCKQCIFNGNVIVYEKGSWAWWLLPTILGIIGGLIAFLFTRNKGLLSPIRSSDYLIVGLLNTFIITLSVFLGFIWGDNYY